MSCYGILTMQSALMMSVPELRDLRDALDQILAAADQSGSGAGH
jgi:hypothetical protein